MTVTAPTAATTTPPPAATSNSANAALDLSQNYSTFLQILTTQLKNQDPLNPMDSSQFTSQLVQFSSVEQQIQANKNLETLISAQAGNSAAGSVNYIGRTVAATSDSVGLSNGQATINYALDSNVAQNSITISDSNGRTIRSLTGETGQGAHSITWDGKDASGNTMPDGTYKIALTATNADQTAATGSIGISGTVTGVTLIDQKPMLAIGGVTVPVANVLSVSGGPGTGL
jgi:flagellar basal-body rod modification protein FlgD